MESSKDKNNKLAVINKLKKVLQEDGRVLSAWVFGSWARGEETPNSDLDIMIEMNTQSKYSIFDLADIAYIIEKQVERKVDLVEKGFIKDFAKKTVTNDLIKIYG
jgi:predicted nucleotidyltransferase